MYNNDLKTYQKYELRFEFLYIRFSPYLKANKSLTVYYVYYKFIIYQNFRLSLIDFASILLRDIRISSNSFSPIETFILLFFHPALR